MYPSSHSGIALVVSRSKQQGLGLPLAIFIITVMAFIAVAINELSEDNARITGVNVLSMRAFYAAESGANVGLHLLFPPTGTPATCNAGLVSNHSFTGAGLAQCNVSVSCTSVVSGSNTLVELTSTGTCGSGDEQATRVVQVVAE